MAVVLCCYQHFVLIRQCIRDLMQACACDALFVSCRGIWGLHRWLQLRSVKHTSRYERDRQAGRATAADECSVLTAATSWHRLQQSGAGCALVVCASISQLAICAWQQPLCPVHSTGRKIVNESSLPSSAASLHIPADCTCSYKLPIDVWLWRVFISGRHQHHWGLQLWW